MYRLTLPYSQELLDQLALADHEGIEEREDQILVYFASETEASGFGLGVVEFVADENWSALAQAEWRPFPVGERFWLCPEWLEDPAPEGRIRLRMFGGNVFGGGDHPTTQICLEALEEVVRPGMRVADVGAGTAILAQAARELGAIAIAGDIDMAAMPYLDYVGSVDALATGVFDLVMANIHLGVLELLREEILRVTKPGGVLLLSGFLEEQEDALLRLFPARGAQVRRRDGWCAALLTLDGELAGR